MIRTLSLACLFPVALALPGLAIAYTPKAEKVVENVYAIVGPTDDRTYDNDGLNNNLGFVVTGEGVVLIDSGASKLGAQRLAEAIRAVTDKPVKWVINTGSQDHRWLGNGYFKAQGAEIIAFKATVDTQQRSAAQQVDSLGKTLKDRFAGTEPVYASRQLEGDKASLSLGGQNFELMRTDAHFPGDALVWMPSPQVVFTGDLVYVERMLGVHDWSSVKNAQAAYQRMKALAPKYVVPGHGPVCDIARADKDTGNYYTFLVDVVGKAASDMAPMDEVINANAERAEFKHLKHYDSWHRTNMNRTYLQFEGQ